jgi:CRISP-associated protein Cas1
MPSLFEQALRFTTLNEAWQRVWENRGCAGSDGETLEEFASDLPNNLTRLRTEVIEGTYRPRPLLRVIAQSPGKKPRSLSIPTVRDRVLQTAVSLMLTPLFEAEFEDCSFAYRKGRSVDLAVRRIMRYRDEGFRWVVDADITAFFDELDQELLMRELRELVKEERLLDLIGQWLRSEVQDGVSLKLLTKGVPQGPPISPLLSNLYLDHLDEALLGENLRLVRFSDDFLILCKDQKQADQALELTEEVLKELKLRLNRAKTRIVDFVRGFRFLGVEFARSLVLKCQSPEMEAGYPEMDPLDEKGERETNVLPDSALASALSQALIEKREELDQEPVDELEVQILADEQAPSSGHEPRLRTLYLMEDGCTLGKESERLVVRKQEKVLQEVPAIKVDQILVFGNSQITTPAMTYCLMERIPIVLLSGKGRYYGVVDSLDTDPVLLQRDQFAKSADPEFCLHIARAIVRGKLANMRLVLRRYARKREASLLHHTDTVLQGYTAAIEKAETLDQVRGYEGITSKTYFEGMRALLPPAWGFERRVRQPPTDPVNSLLSYGYTLLFYNIYALIRARGLNAHVGFLHPLRSGHPALVSDLMEEFRALVIDALMLSLVLNDRLAPSDFLLPQTPDSPCLLSDAARKQVIHAFEKKMNATVTHPTTGLRLDYRRCIDEQVRIMAGVIRGKLEGYTPMVLR